MEFITHVQAAGRDFFVTLEFTGDIPPAILFDPGNVTSNDLDTVLQETLPQLRQRALLASLRSCIIPGGEAARLIKDCVNASGTVAGVPQAWITMKTRWYTTEPPKPVGAIAAALLTKPFPNELSVAAYQVHVNKTLSMATDVGLNPLTDDPAAAALRLTYWDVFASPPAGSLYDMAAAEARTVTGALNTTIAHRDAFITAMVSAVAARVKASGKRPARSTGVGKTMQANFGGLEYEECIHPEDWELAEQDVHVRGAFVPPPGLSPPQGHRLRSEVEVPLA